MKTMQKKLTLTIGALACGCSLVPYSAVAENVSLYDYKEATSAYEDAYLNGQFDYQSGNQEQSSYNLDLGLDYEKVFSSAARNTKIDFTGATSRKRGPNASDESISNYLATGSITSDQYLEPNSNGAFWYGKGDIGLRKGMEDPFSKLTVGMGYGRVVNVTPMAKAMRLVEELKEHGLLKSEPSKSTYQKVAEIIAKEEEYRRRLGADDYKMKWIGDIETALGDSIGSSGAIKVYEVLTNERISTRKHGWLVRGGVGAVLSNYDGSNGDPVLEVAAEYHLPISSLTQFSNEFSLSTVLNDEENNYIVQNLMTLTHEISDKVDWENSWLANYSIFEESNDILSNTLSSTYRYHISNALSYTTTVRLTSIEDDIDDNGNDDIDKSVVMGITYRLK